MAQAPSAARGVALAPFPSLVPAEAAEVEEPAAVDMLRSIQVCSIGVPAMGVHVQTAYVTNEDGAAGGASALCWWTWSLTRLWIAGDAVQRCPRAGLRAPILLLHGFDSSLLEFRRLFPRLAAGGAEVWAVDLAGANA